MKQICASTVAQAFWTLDPFALIQSGDPWYCNLESMFDPLHYGLGRQLTRRLTPSPGCPEFFHVGVVGHKGTGKTTQVRRVMANLESSGVRAFFVDALTLLDQADLSFSDLILVLANTVVAGLTDAKAELPKDHVDLLRLWFAEELLTESHRKEILGSLETGASVTTGIPFLSKLAAKVTAVLKTDNEYRKEIRRRADRDPADLVRRMNALLDAAALSLKASKLTLVVDNLEKLPDRKQVDAAILRRADEIRRLRCHLVLFFDPADQYAPVTVQVRDAFDMVTLPMLPIRGPDDSDETIAEPALRAVRELLGLRVDLPQVFQDVDECVRLAALLSGGRLRDIFHLARMACEAADPDKVTPEHFRLAARRLGGERLALARPSHWARLASIHREKQVANDPDDAHLLLHSLVLNYDGEPWWDVHPLVCQDKRFLQHWKPLVSTGP